MGPDSLARRTGQPVVVARDLLRRHRQTYRQFWLWSESIIHTARLRNSLHTVLGWRVAADEQTPERKLRNFPMQANGAEMLRAACCFGLEAGVRLCAPVHDAILIEAPEPAVESAAATMVEAMRDASRAVLGGMCLRVEHKIIRYPDRFEDDHPTWRLVTRLLDEIEDK